MVSGNYLHHLDKIVKGKGYHLKEKIRKEEESLTEMDDGWHCDFEMFLIFFAEVEQIKS